MLLQRRRPVPGLKSRGLLECSGGGLWSPADQPPVLMEGSPRLPQTWEVWPEKVPTFSGDFLARRRFGAPHPLSGLEVPHIREVPHMHAPLYKCPSILWMARITCSVLWHAPKVGHADTWWRAHLELLEAHHSVCAPSAIHLIALKVWSILDEVALKLKKQAHSLGGSTDCLLPVYQVSQLCPFLRRDDPATVVVVYVQVRSRLDYCNIVYVGLPSKSVQKLHLAQDTATRMQTGMGWRNHMIPVLAHLHWLSICSWAQFKVLV